MMSKRQVHLGDFGIGQAPDVLVVYGLGSCLGVALYDAQARIGGLAHILLPAPLPGVNPGRPGKYVHLALPAMVAELVGEGADRARLVAKLAGCAQMFEGTGEGARLGIGQRNLEAARRALDELGIAVVAEATGGHYGRTLEFHLATGVARVLTAREPGGEIEL